VKINLSTFQENSSSLATISGNCCHWYFTLIEKLKGGGGDPQFSFTAFSKPTAQRTVFFSRVKDFKYLNSQGVGGERKNKSAVQTIVTTTISCSTLKNMLSSTSHCY